MQLLSPNQSANLVDTLITTLNHSVYDTRHGNPNYNLTPHVLYFYYLRLLPQDDFEARHYVFDNGTNPIVNDENNLKNILRDMAINARQDGTLYPEVGTNLENIQWQRKSYVAFLMDSPTWTFIPTRALVFNTRKGSTPNHSFYDGRDLPVDVSAGGNGSELVTAVCCINHMKRNPNGDDLLKREKQRFVFSLFFRMGNFPWDMELDPDGTNLGPPVSPP